MSDDPSDEDPSRDDPPHDDHVLTPDEREWTTTERGDHAFRRAKLADPAGGEQLGCSLYELPPGKTGWPYHFHTGNEEAAFVLDGEATLRTPEGERTVESGSYVVFPTGEEGAHQFRNESDEPVRLLLLSGMQDPDVLGYPDSGKVGVYAGAAPGGDKSKRVFSDFFRETDAVDYWTDEPGSEDEADGDDGT